MSSSPGSEHGGAVDAAAARYGIPRDAWLDLSTGINPNPYPLPAIDPAAWQRLPDVSTERALCRAAAECYGVADPAMVVPTPGSQAAIQWLPRLFSKRRVAVLSPTYNEHAPAWRNAGHQVIETADPGDAEVVVVVNPNNPDGRVRPPENLLALGSGRSGRLLVVDEAFADVVPEASLAGHVGRPGLIILRSVGKVYGLAGMRLGFVLAAPDVAAAVRRAIGPWAVGGPVAEAGAAALSDADWLAATRQRLAAAADRLDALLTGSGIGVIGGTPLFRLAETAEAGALFDHLAGAAVLVRPFAAHPTWLRFGLPGDDAGFQRLADMLRLWREKDWAVREAR